MMAGGMLGTQGAANIHAVGTHHFEWISVRPEPSHISKSAVAMCLRQKAFQERKVLQGWVPCSAPSILRDFCLTHDQRNLKYF